MGFGAEIEGAYLEELSKNIREGNKMYEADSNGALLALKITQFKAQAQGIDKLQSVNVCLEVYKSVSEIPGYKIALKQANKKMDLYYTAKKSASSNASQVNTFYDQSVRAWSDFRKLAYSGFVERLQYLYPGLKLPSKPDDIAEFFKNNKDIDPTGQESLGAEAIFLLMWKIRKLQREATLDAERAASLGAEKRGDAKKDKSCAYCQTEGCTMLCGGCKRVYYCSTSCAKRNWKIHKPVCVSTSKKTTQERREVKVTEVNIDINV